MPSSTLAASSAEPLVIRALEPPFASRQLMNDVPVGQVWLQGRSLPYRPIVFHGRQRVKTTWLPGNPTATQQVMGATEEPTTINGTWKDKFLGNGVARSLANLFTEIRRSGCLLEVSWAGIVRRGILTDTEFTVDRPQDVAFKLEFTWRGDDAPVAPALVAVGVENPRQGFQEVSTKVQAMLDEVAAFREDALSSLVGLSDSAFSDLDDLVGEAETAVELLETGLDIATQVVEAPAVMAQRAIQVAQRAADVARRTGDFMLDLDALTQVPHDRALELLAFLNLRFSVCQSSDAAQEQARQSAEAMRGQASPEVLAEVRPPPGTDLRDLALTYYGDPDLWTLIAQYNGLEGSAVPAPPTGASDDPAPPILIPRRLDGALSELGC